LRTHCLKKFFITQLTNHGVEDKILNFFICHKIPEVDRVYWFRRVEELRKIYAQRQQYLNPINGKKNVCDLKQIEGIQAKIKELEEKIDNLLKINNIEKLVKEIVSKELKTKISISKFESKMVTTEKERISG
jgi:hypothetical protein